jgi:glutaminase
MSDAVPNLELVVKEIADEMRQRSDRGAVATDIPELARALISAGSRSRR